MLRTVALLIVLALAAPSVGALVCDLACGAGHEASAPAASGSCHDHQAPRSDSPALSALHVCHEMGVVPASIVRDAGLQLAVAPAIVDARADGIEAGRVRAIVATHARRTGHAPPPLALPLRI